MVHVRVWLIAWLSLSLFAGCVSPYDPDVHPRRLVSKSETTRLRPVDLDGNGRDELVRRGRAPGGPDQTVFIRSLGGRAVAQLHFSGAVQSVRFVDVDQNGRLEIIVPVQEEDSLFYNVISGDGRLLHRFFAVGSGAQPGRENADPWDIRGAYMRAADVTGDGEKELISFFKTGFAEQPRGVWVHSYPEGRVLGQLPIGAMPNGDFHFGDSDGDGRREWIFGSIATNNGATGAGMSDDHAYVGAIEVTPSPQIEWVREMGDTFAGAEVRAGDIDGDGDVEILAVRMPREGRQTSSPLQKLDAQTGEVLDQYMPASILRDVQVGNLDRDAAEEIVTLDESGTVQLLNEDLRVIRRRRFDVSVRDIETVSDLNGDGRDELVVYTKNGVLWLSSDFSTVAATPLRGTWRVVETGVGQAPRVAIYAPDRKGKMYLVSIEGNPLWWFFRYGPMAGLVVGAFVLLAGSVVAGRRYQSVRVRDAIREEVVSHSPREWLLLHPNGAIDRVSDGAAELLALDGPDVTRDVLRAERPSFAAELGELAANSAVPDDRSVTVGGRTLSVAVTPLDVFQGGRPYWLVWLEPESATSDTHRAHGLMAQRVAHDLKNPLTSILLTLQRMQMAYREENGQLAQTLDSYTERIEERIASLRRMTTNVLKFVGKEDIRRTPTNFHAFLDDHVETLEKNLPPDIDFRRAFDTEMPSVAVDRDQMQSVIENLVTNAVEAMPDGGRLTVSARLARDLCFDGYPTRDYVVVEVQDTGVGMTKSERERMFEPGFSTRDDTGLGMALVRKVVEDHEGMIEVESEPDIGTSISLYLPTEREEEVA